MTWTIDGEDTTVTFDFTLDGQFVLPDEGSVKVTVRSSDGAPFPGWNQEVQDGVFNTTLNLKIPATLNAIPEGLSFETRYVRVQYTVDGLPRSETKHYRITPFIPLQTSEDKVRARLGASEKEVPDSDIDLHAAYYKLIDSGQVNLSVAMKSNTGAAIAANNAVEIKAALEHLPALASKLAQSESQDNATRVRMKLDIPALRKDLLSTLAEELNSMSTLMGGLAEVTPTLMMLVTPTDVITG